MVLYIWKYVSECQFEKIAVIDYAVSVIWIQRYQSPGEFELYLPASRELLDLFLSDVFFLITKEDDEECAMVIETVQLTTDDENGDRIIVTGRSSECILEQRIIMYQLNVNGSAANTIYYLLDECAIHPSRGSNLLKSMRKIPELSIGTWLIDSESVHTQYDGEILLEVVESLCISSKMGFKMVFTGTGFSFQLYRGLDRTVTQTENSPVIFSPDYDNLGATDFLYDKTTYYNLIQESGEGQGSERRHVEVYESTEKKGLFLREKHIDAENISSQTEEGEMDSSTYGRILKNRADDNLRKATETKEFSGEILDTGMYQFGIDYGLGDTVSVINAYGIEGTAVVTEVMETEDETGYRLTPTFSDWKVK